jgi:hypothetical protein
VLLAALGCVLASCGTVQHNLTTEAVPHPGLAVFDGSPTPADALPPEIIAMLSRSSHPEFGKADIRAARRVLANDPGWLVPASNGEMCLVRLVYPLIAKVHSATLPPIPLHTCATKHSAETGRLVETQSLATSGTRSHDNKIVGIAPNSVATVKILSDRGSDTTVDVIRNAYEAIVVDPVAVLFLTLGHGKVLTHTVPLTTFSATNERR